MYRRGHGLLDSTLKSGQIRQPPAVLGVTSHRLLMVAGIPQVARAPYPKFEAPIRNAIQLEPLLRGVALHPELFHQFHLLSGQAM